LRFPKVTIQFGEPLSFPVESGAGKERQLEVAQQIFDLVREMYGRLEAQGRRAVLRSRSYS
jgi:1-acyl-sn-glycerol-3-phosphate acyltransferase